MGLWTSRHRHPLGLALNLVRMDFVSPGDPALRPIRDLYTRTFF